MLKTTDTYIGKPCKHCGGVVKATKGRSCINNCASINWKKNNAERHAELNKVWAANNFERKKAVGKIWALANKSSLVKANLKYRKSHGHLCGGFSRYKSRMPKWADVEAMKRIYLEAELLTTITKIRHEVDHIIPMNNKYVCGLHTEANLNMTTKGSNNRKKNRMPWKNTEYFLWYGKKYGRDGALSRMPD